MGKPYEVVKEHECEVLEKYNSTLKKKEIGIQMLSDLHWYWVRWYDGEDGNTAEGIAYCPYCGEKL